MNYYLIEDMKRDVRIALDENAVSDKLLTDADPDTLTLDEIIESRIPIAARIVETIAPLPLLGGGEAFGDSIGWESQPGYGMGFILLPDDLFGFAFYFFRKIFPQLFQFMGGNVKKGQ